MAPAIVVVPSAVVCDLRRIVVTDSTGRIEADDPEIPAEDAHLLGQLREGDCEPRERELRTEWPELLRSLVSGEAEDAVNVLSEVRGGLLERREAIRRLRVAATILERMEGTA